MKALGGNDEDERAAIREKAARLKSVSERSRSCSAGLPSVASLVRFE
jgi:hypothetical protein